MKNTHHKKSLLIIRPKGEEAIFIVLFILLLLLTIIINYYSSLSKKLLPQRDARDTQPPTRNSCLTPRDARVFPSAISLRAGVEWRGDTRWWESSLGEPPLRPSHTTSHTALHSITLPFLCQ